MPGAGRAELLRKFTDIVLPMIAIVLAGVGVGELMSHAFNDRLEEKAEEEGRAVAAACHYKTDQSMLDCYRVCDSLGGNHSGDFRKQQISVCKGMLNYIYSRDSFDARG